MVVDLSTEQAENAALIAAIGVQRGLPARAVSIALATAYQESKIQNLDHGDRDSLGLFQQRPSQGWGTAEQIQNPRYAINRFYDELEKIDGFETMRITEAAQEVQRSGFPEAYEDHAEDGRALASALTGYSRAKFTCVVREEGADAQRLNAAGLTPRAAKVRRDLERAFGTQTLGGFAGALRRARDRHLLPADQPGQPATGLGDGPLPRRAGRAAGDPDGDLRQEDLDRGPVRVGVARLRPGRRTRRPRRPPAPRPRARRRRVKLPSSERTFLAVGRVIGSRIPAPRVRRARTVGVVVGGDPFSATAWGAGNL